MPYESNDDLPDSIKRLPSKAQTMFRKAFNRVLEKGSSEEYAFKVAWSMVKKHFKKTEHGWVAHGLGYEVYSFDMQNTGDVFVQHGEDGNYYLEGVLADTLPVSDGWAFTEGALAEFARQINEEGVFGGLTHEEYQDLLMKYSHLPPQEFVKHARTERKGIFKTLKAVFENGKLWIKALIDKRYVRHAKRFTKMSIEAWIPKNLQREGKYYGGKILGFALDNNPKNRRTSVQIS